MVFACGVGFVLGFVHLLVLVVVVIVVFIFWVVVVAAIAKYICRAHLSFKRRTPYFVLGWLLTHVAVH